MQYEEIALAFNEIKYICEWTWSQSWRNKYRFFTSTNGTLIHGDIQEWLHKHNRQISCGLSLDGTPEVHNSNRDNSYDKIDISFFLANWPNQPVKMTIAPHGVNNLSESIIHIHKLGFKLAGTNFAEGIDWSKKGYLESLCKELKKLVEFYIGNPSIPVAPLLDIPIENCECKREHIPNKYCAVRSLMAYDVDGKPYPCNFITPMTFSRGQLDKLSISDFYEDDNLIDKYCFGNCYFYPVCPNCYGANLLVNGKLSERDKSKCNLVKLQCYYSAALHAHRIIQEVNSQKQMNTAALDSTIRAIQRIKDICESEFKGIE